MANIGSHQKKNFKNWSSTYEDYLLQTCKLNLFISRPPRRLCFSSIRMLEYLLAQSIPYVVCWILTYRGVVRFLIKEKKDIIFLYLRILN